MTTWTLILMLWFDVPLTAVPGSSSEAECVEAGNRTVAAFARWYSDGARFSCVKQPRAP